MFELYDEEKKVLGSIEKLEREQGKKAASFYAVAADLDADTNRLIPIIERLEEDGYITDSGVIYRYLHITEKGRALV